MRQRAVTFIGAVVALVACDKLPPEEIVHTGQMDAGTTLLDASFTPRGDGGTRRMPTTDVVPQCGPSPVAEADFTKERLLASMGQCAARRACEFEAYQADLAQKVRRYRESPSEATRTAAQDAFLIANASWQRNELYRFGPAASRMDPGGQGLREEIQAFPLFDRCKVDEQLVSRTYEAPDFEASVPSGRTLAALEYLLFYQGVDNGCSPRSPINANGTWAALPPDELGARKRAYAEVVAAQVAARALALKDAWDPAKGNFLARFAGAGTGNPVYPDQQLALNALGTALMYLDREVKDEKLGEPLGVVPDCMGGGCEQRVESPYAGVSLENVRVNLTGFRELLEGCGDGHVGLGIDDWLRSVGGDGERVATAMLRELSEAQAGAETLDDPLEQTILQDRAKVELLREAVRDVTTLMKTELFGLLNIELPMNLEGDND